MFHQNQAPGLSAGALPGLIQRFRDYPVLHQKHVFNTALLNLPASQRELVPLFFKEVVTNLGIPPNATAVAKVMRVLGKLQRESEAKALWRDWLVCPSAFAFPVAHLLFASAQHSPQHWGLLCSLQYTSLHHCVVFDLLYMRYS